MPNVRGTVFLNTIGINPHNLTQEIIVLDCLYLLLVRGGGCSRVRVGGGRGSPVQLDHLPPLLPQAIIAFGLLYWRMPRPKRIRSSHAAPM